MSHLIYSLRLVQRSLRRDPAYSAVMIVTLVFSVSLFVTALAAFRRIAGLNEEAPRRLPGVYRVQPRTSPLIQFYDSPEYAKFVKVSSAFLAAGPSSSLLGTGVPRAESVSFLSQHAAGVPGRPPRLLPVRFCAADLFTIFESDFAYGSPWRWRTSERPRPTATATGAFSGSAGAPGSPPPREVVLNSFANEELFGGRNSVGREVVIEGRPLKVVGVLGRTPALHRELWNFNPLGSASLFLIPSELAETFRPVPLPQIPPIFPQGWDDLLTSKNRFLEIWVLLPDPASRRRYQTIAAAIDPELVLMPAASENPLFDQVPPAYRLFLGFTTAVLLANILNIVRLLLAKGMARSPEIGIHRALGATREAIFTRQLIEGVVVVMAGSLVGILLAVPAVALFDMLVPDLPAHLALDVATAVIASLVCVLLSVLAGIYPAWRMAAVPPTRYLGRI